MDKPADKPAAAPAASGKRESRASARRKAQRAIEIAEEQHRREMLRKRIELANQGLKAYKKGDHVHAVQAFRTYLGILEHWKSVHPGGLTPSHFDAKKDVAEMLLISGVYWDLCKVYDRADTPKARQEFQRFLEKFVLFSNGMPYQSLCAESLRKYWLTGKPVNVESFKQAYKLIGNNRCFVATSLLDVMDDAETLPRLRRFRDEHLARHAAGRAFTRAYYRVGPGAASLVDRLPNPVRRALALGLDRIGRALD